MNSKMECVAAVAMKNNVKLRFSMGKKFQEERNKCNNVATSIFVGY